MADKQAYDALLETLRAEFVDDSADQLNQIELLAGNLLQTDAERGSTVEDSLIQLRRLAHSMKGTAGAVDFPVVAVILHKLEDYVDTLVQVTPTAQHVQDIEKYVDAAREYCNMNVNQEADYSDMLRSLPNSAKRTATTETASNSTSNIHAILIMEEKISGHIFERELTKHGLSVTRVRNPFHALEMTVRTKPDIVITGSVLAGMSGIDVVRAVRAMSITQDIPTCVMTSFTRDHPDLAGLPQSTQLIHKKTLETDVNHVLSHFKLTA